MQTLLKEMEAIDEEGGGVEIVEEQAEETATQAQINDAPVATADQIIFVLGDFRGDIWTMDLDPSSRRR